MGHKKKEAVYKFLGGSIMKYFVYILWTKVFSWSIVASTLLIRNLFVKRVTAFCPLLNAMP